MSKNFYSFTNGEWKNELVTAYSFRFTETPEFTECPNHITTAVNKNHREGFDNISLLSKENYTAGVKARLRCSFDGIGCPEIILVKQPEQCEDGAVRYGECFEVVLWKNGVNVWRMWMENGEVTWKQLMGVEFPVSESEIHTLSVLIENDTLHIEADDRKMQLYIDDLYPEFHLGLNACEGINRFYDLEIM